MKLPHEVCATEECQRIIQIFRQSNQDYKIFKQSFAVSEQERLEAEKKEQEKAAFERLSPLEKLCKTKNIFLPPKPPKVIGNIEKIGSMMFQRLNRFLVVDPDQGALMRFKKKNNYPLKPSEVIPLKEIQNIKIVSPGVFMDPNFNYFEVIFDNRQIFSCKTIITAKLWVYYIYQAAVFASFLSELERQGYDIDSLNQKNSPVIELKDDNQQDRVIWEDLQNRNKIPQAIQQNQQTDSQTQEQKNSSSPSSQNKIKQSLSQLQNQHAKNSVEKKQNDTNSEKNSPLKTQDTISGESNKQTKNSKNSQNERMKQMMQPVKDFDSKSQEVVNFQSFDIIKILGQGAFGKVFLVRNKNNGILYAMKALKKKNLILKKQLRFAVTESNVLKNCNSTFVMGLHYAFQTPAYLYLVMDYCPGGDLAQHIMQKGSFDDKTAKFYIAELVLAIENLHSKNIIYRDLKPENILLAQDGHIKLADFGLSKENIGKNENTSTFCGTPAYLSPEMVIHKKASPMSDIYGIGCCLYEMLTGDPPFYTDDIPTMYKQIKDSSLKFPNNINKQTKEFLKRILEKNPEKRLGYKGFQEIKNDPYFKEINFEHVEEKKLEPPIIEFEDEDEDEELAIFNNNRIGQNQFRDTDYTEQNKKINRVIKFTFVRDQNSTQNYL
ncbi:Protein kinase-like domain [Pseudocohnilembus persalinus]|uniref:Protein kinase-like domain n=1 Tax=Pseudocohnilembus persalinus TaxID=266149 RepID=A0A0V0QA37_PSEPJ|nr:Protein kinase-like domain [Pseudocohnilembus persalinus]|eukprot:KRW99091.1 Protein kinase-like domain [Pseudocohnilembus persalinus]